MAITANDEPTEIEADVDKRFSSIVVNLPVQQTGTGTPSPTNPRPFTVWTDVSLYVSDTEEADEPTLSIELPTPLYGGKIDMVRGEIATTYNSKESGTGWEMTQEGQFRCQVSAYNNGDETSTNVADLYAVHYETVSNKDAYDATDDLTCGLATIDGTTYLYVNDAQYTTLESFATHIADEVFVFRAHIPMSDVTEPHIVYLPEGTSYVWAEGAYVEYTVSGATPLHFSNALAKPMSITTNIKPVQDLHGQESPWPAGGGKNKIDQSAYTSLDATSYSNGVFTAESLSNLAGAMIRLFKNDVIVTTVSKIPTEGSRVFLNITVDDQWDTCFIGYRMGGLNNVGGWFNKPNVPDGSYTVSFMADKLPSSSVYGKFSDIQFESGSTATTFAPYSNICPISGWDEVNVWDDPVQGGTVEWNQNVNLVQPTTIVSGGLTCEVSTGGKIAFSGTRTDVANFTIGQRISVIAGHKYFASLGDLVTSTSGNLFMINSWSSTFWIGTISTCYMSTSGTVSIRMDTLNPSGDYYPMLFDLTAMFGAGNEPTTVAEFRALFPNDYYPYNAGETMTVGQVNGETYRHYTIEMPTEAGTVYGGELTVNKDGSGSLVVDRAEVDLENLTFAVSTSTNEYHSFRITNIRTVPPSSDSDLIHAICSGLKSLDYDSYWTANSIAPNSTGQDIIRVIVPTDINTVEELKVAVAGMQLVYELPTPLTYSLTATQVKALKGDNNIWTDCGDEMSVTYTGKA